MVLCQDCEGEESITFCRLPGYVAGIDRFPINSVDGPAFKKVLAYVRHRCLPHRNDMTNRDVEAYFMNVDDEMLFKLILVR